MAKAKKAQPHTPEHYDHGPEIRIARGEVVVNGKQARIRSDALRIDQLLNRGVIDDMQHFECYKLRVHWIGGGRQPLRSVQFRERLSGTANAEGVEIHRLSNSDRYFFLMAHVSNLSAKLLYAVVLEELPLRESYKAINTGRHGNERLALHEAIKELTKAFDELYDYENPKT